ncbi:MAG: phytanoyl-CoA dioxygenase family protein [Acidimicrobiia bacterium]
MDPLNADRRPARADGSRVDVPRPVAREAGLARAVAAQGWAVLPGALDATATARSAAALDEVFAAEDDIARARRWRTAGYRVAYMLPAKHPELLALCRPGRLSRAAAEVLGEGCVVAAFNGLAVVPGGEAQPLHRDHLELTPGVTLYLHAVVALDRFTTANGATLVVPGTHLEPGSADAPDGPAQVTAAGRARTGGGPAQATGAGRARTGGGPAQATGAGRTGPVAGSGGPEPSIDDVSPTMPTAQDRAVAVELEPGDALVYDATCLHAAGANTSEAPRRALHVLFARRWVQPLWDFPASLRPQDAARLDEATRRLLGFDNAPARYDHAARRAFGSGWG